MRGILFLLFVFFITVIVFVVLAVLMRLCSQSRYVKFTRNNKTIPQTKSFDPIQNAVDHCKTLPDGSLLVRISKPKPLYLINRNMLPYITKSAFEHCGVLYTHPQTKQQYMFHMTKKNIRFHTIEHFVVDSHKNNFGLVSIPLDHEIKQTTIERAISNMLSQGYRFDRKGYVKNLFFEKNNFNDMLDVNCTHFVILYLIECGIIEDCRIESRAISPKYLKYLYKTKKQVFKINETYHFKKPIILLE